MVDTFELETNCELRPRSVSSHKHIIRSWVYFHNFETTLKIHLKGYLLMASHFRDSLVESICELIIGRIGKEVPEDASPLGFRHSTIRAALNFLPWYVEKNSKWTCLKFRYTNMSHCRLKPVSFWSCSREGGWVLNGLERRSSTSTSTSEKIQIN